MAETRIVQGIKVTIDPAALTDWDVVNSLIELTSSSDDETNEGQIQNAAEKMAALSTVLDIIFTKKQIDTIKKSLREANGGYLPIEAVVYFINQIFEEFKEKKS